MEAEGADAFIANKSVNVEYLTGFDHIRDTSNPHAVLVTADEACFLTDARYLEVAETQALKAQTCTTPDAAIWQVDNPGDKLVIKDMHEIWDFARFAKIALEDSVPYRIFELLKASAQPAELVPAKNWIEDIRSVKDAHELERIKAAQAITDKTLAHLCAFIRPGLTEKEVALELEYTLRKLGADDVAFSPIVASGPNGSLPHAVPSDRVLEAGDLLTLDFGASYGGYCSDMTRTIFIGGTNDAGESVQPSEEQRKVYETVLAAQEASLAAFREGVTGIEVDAAGREVIKAAGYGDYFVHGTGHGVGLYIHEQPNATPRSEGKLKAGEVITCEPGIYLPGKLGVRIEDMVIVTEEGSINITASPKELLVVNREFFTSERLLFRKPTKADIPAIFDSWTSDQEAVQWMGWKRHETLDDTQAFIDLSDKAWREDGVGPFLIESLDDGFLVGSAGLTLTQSGEAEVGYIIARPHWGLGYASESLLAAISYASKRDFKRIIARVHEDNLVSAHILEKHGFTAPDKPLTRGQCPNLESQDYAQLDFELLL